MILITLGDPLSINVEALATILHPSSEERKSLAQRPIILIGSLWHWQEQLELLGTTISSQIIESSKQEEPPLGLWFYPIEAPQIPTTELSSQQRGSIAYKSLAGVKNFINKKTTTVVITAPINKFIAQKGGLRFNGQTEFFENIANKQGLMLLSNSKLNVALVTNHLPISKVASSLSIDLIAKKLRTYYTSLQKYFHIPRPRIGVCGLNPHSGDCGLIGSEDMELIIPAIKHIAKTIEYPQNIQGPLSADTVFWHSLHGKYDGVLAMYHDQGLAPIKTLSFDQTIHMTCGLPFLRISPDHGPASDLYLKKKASSHSFKLCFQLASKYLAEN